MFYMIVIFINRDTASHSTTQGADEFKLRQQLKEEEVKPGFMFGAIYDEKQSLKSMASRGLQNTAHIFEAIVPDMILGGYNSPHTVQMIDKEF